jgi:hypothetical protein
METQSREKPLRGSQTQEFHYSEDEARYKIVTLTGTDAVVVPCSLTCNLTRTLPNQVSYLKGSSMEFLTLEPTSKIDFSCSAMMCVLMSTRKRTNRLQYSVCKCEVESTWKWSNIGVLFNQPHFNLVPKV